MSDKSPAPKFPKLCVHKIEKHGYFVYEDGIKSEKFHNIFIANMQLLHAYSKNKVDDMKLRRGLSMIAESSLPVPRTKNKELDIPVHQPEYISEANSKARNIIADYSTVTKESQR